MSKFPKIVFDREVESSALITPWKALKLLAIVEMAVG